MKRLALAALAALSVSAVTPAFAVERTIEVGRLSCNVEPGIGLLIGSSKKVACTFTRKGHEPEYYSGKIAKLGFDVGVTGKQRIEWLVFAAADTEIASQALSGKYVGGSSQVTLGIGVGSNFLVGGSRKAYALQPWSVSVQTGLSAAIGLAQLTLN